MEMEKLWRGLEFLVPSYLEIQVSLSVAFIILFVYFLCLNFPSPEMNDAAARESEEEEGKRNEEIQKEVDENAKIGQYKEESRANSAFVIQVELLAARNLVAANINGTSDPYAIISCGEQKRFSSMVPSSRNPIWGEEFNFFVEDLPTELLIAIHDWDIVWKSNVLGSATVPVGTETQAGQIWYELDSTGEVCIQIKTLKLPENSSRALTNYAGANTRRRISLDGPGPTVVHQKPGPMQTIFDLPPDEIVEHSYSCALERSFLYHGRMYVSAWHICFHSNVFSKQIKVMIPFGDIDEIRKSQHAVINPAITIVLRTGAGGYGVPPLSSPDGRVKYMFASFWNRSHTIRILQKSAENYLAMRLAEKKELEQSAKRALSSSVRRPANYESVIPENIVGRNAKVQPFIKEEVLVSIVEDVFPCTAEQFFLSLLNDDSKFISEYRSQRQDTDLNMGQWHVAEEYDGQVRELKYRSICHSPMCPPYTAMTEWQHYVLSKSKLVFETVQQAHDVPFGSYFEIHCRWSLQTNSSSTCTLNIKVGAHFKKWCPMQSKIKNGAVDEYKKEVDEMLQIARLYLKKYGSLNTGNNEITSITIQV